MNTIYNMQQVNELLQKLKDFLLTEIDTKQLPKDITDKVNAIITNGDGTLFLSNDGTYKRIELTNLIDNTTLVINDNNKLTVKNLDGLTTTIADLNSIPDLKNTIDNLKTTLSNPMRFIDVYSSLSDLTGTYVSGDTVIINDGTNSMTYIYNGTNWKPVMEFKLQIRDFNLDPIDLTSEVTGVLPQANMDLTGLVKDTEVLKKDNTIVYTPTGDYNPATKKYIDDALKQISIDGAVILRGEINDLSLFPVNSKPGDAYIVGTSEKQLYIKLLDNSIFGLNSKIDISNYYNKVEVDNLLKDKADINDHYNKTDIDKLLKDKADINDYYNKTDTDKLLDLKLNINDLVAGNNITITKNASGKYEISSTGSGSGSANIDDNNISNSTTYSSDKITKLNNQTKTDIINSLNDKYLTTEKFKGEADDSVKYADNLTSLKSRQPLQYYGTDNNNEIGLHYLPVNMKDNTGIEQRVILNAQENENIIIDSALDISDNKVIIDSYKLVEGENDIVETVKSFDNSDKNDFFFDDENVEFTDSMHINKQHVLSSTLNADGLYESKEINVSDYIDDITFEEVYN